MKVKASIFRYELADRVDELVMDPSPARVEAVFEHFERRRREVPTPDWEAFVRDVIHSDPFATRLRECPYTHRVWTKPRGYAGDAELLDYLYFGEGPDYIHDSDVSPVGRAVFDYCVRGGAGEAVRERRRRIAEAVDAAAAERPGARVLAVASGYLREASWCKSLPDGRIRRWVCLDQDPASIRGMLPLAERFRTVSPACVPVRRLLLGKLDDRSRYDVCYVPDLLESLDERTAELLVIRLFRMLAPGGRLLLANNAPGIPERGYTEAVGDWWRIYRTEEQLRALTTHLPEAETSIAVYRDDADRILYLDLRRT